MEADFCVVCDVTLSADCVTPPGDDHLTRLTRLLQTVVAPIADTHIRPCGTCENKMSQVEVLLEELRVAYYETRKCHTSSAWTEGVIAEDERLYYKGQLTVVQTETIGTQTEETKHTEMKPPDIMESQPEGTPETKVSKGRSLRKPTELQQIKQEADIECMTPIGDLTYMTPVKDLTCPVCGDQLRTQGGYRRHLKNHGAESGHPNTPRVKTEQSADGKETQTPRKRGRPPGSKSGKKKEEKAEGDRVAEDGTRTDLLPNLQDHIYSELSAPSAGTLQHVDDDDVDYNMADDDADYTGKVNQNKTPRRRYRRRAKSEGVVSGPPYQCETCQKVFKDIYGLDRHREMVHSSTPMKRFACDKCDVSFKWKQSLTAHQKCHMDTEPSAADGHDDADGNIENDNEENKVDLEENKTPRRQYRKRVNSGGAVVGPPFECETCQKMFKVKRDLERHQEMVHSSSPTERFACDKCDVTFKWKQSLKAHQKLHMDNDTASDNIRNDNDQDNSPHRKRGKSEGVAVESPFECLICQKTFPVKRDLQRHQEMVHFNDPTKRFPCDKCDITFKWKQSLMAHRKRHMDSEEGADLSAEDRKPRKTPRRKYKKEGGVDGPPFECEICQKIFKYRQVLERHQQMVHQRGVTERFPCDQCNLTFKWKQSLKAHLRLHSDARPFVCTLCPKAFRSSGTLRQHILSHEGTKLYQCHICNLRFTRSMRLQIHLRSHTGELPYVCDQCGKGFADPQIFKRHMREHSGERPYVCGDCGKGFTMARYLSEHRKGHTGMRDYLCSTCGAAFANSGRLRRHMGVHGTKKHACTLCDKTYKYKEALANHMNMHMGVKPHLCSHCGRSFSQRSGLRQHALSHTAQPKPFKCDICDKQFSTAAKVRRHAVLHGVKPVSKGSSQVFEVAIEDASVDILESHNETYDRTLVLEISSETEPFIPAVAAVEETSDMEETAAEVSAASQSLLQVLTQEQQSKPAPSSPASQHPTIQLTSSKLKAHLNRGQRQQAPEETVQVIEYKEEEEEEEGEHQVAAAGTQTIYLQPATSGASSSLGQIYQVVGSGGSILYQIQQ